MQALHGSRYCIPSTRFIRGHAWNGAIVRPCRQRECVRPGPANLPPSVPGAGPGAGPPSTEALLASTGAVLVRVALDRNLDCCMLLPPAHSSLSPGPAATRRGIRVAHPSRASASESCSRASESRIRVAHPHPSRASESRIRIRVVHPSRASCGGAGGRRGAGEAERPRRHWRGEAGVPSCVSRRLGCKVEAGEEREEPLREGPRELLQHHHSHLIRD